MTASAYRLVSNEEEAVGSLHEFRAGDQPLQTSLRTDARVIARVTDGIYRQPASALRELISNAYDADARHVTIKTDRPRFNRMTVEDDGLGMSPDVLMRTLYHIGGSAKRTDAAVRLGISDATDATRSPGGRELIGKIGIGLFSVAQLTHSFQIITKQAGDQYRTVASVVMRQFSEAAAGELHEDQEYEAGKVLLWREHAPDIDSQGTTVVLDAIRPQTRDTLRSRGTWEAVVAGAASDSKIRPPSFHIGAVQPELDDHLIKAVGSPNLPWSAEDGPAEAFDLLVRAVRELARTGIPNVHLDKQLDYYLKMVWDLSLWVPLPYLDRHPFELSARDGLTIYRLSELARGADARPWVSEAGAGLSPKAAVTSPTNFSVLVDDLELARPLLFTDFISTNSALQRPILVVGHAEESFAEVPKEVSGGPLSFQAYFYWAPKIVPSEHQGVMVRIHDAAGTYFDPGFFRFPVDEQRRMGQLTCEVFITEGFDGVLNIDRESFNFSHTHTVYLSKWIHAALRRVIALQKRLSSQALANRKSSEKSQAAKTLADVVASIWRERSPEDASDPPVVAFDEDGSRTDAELRLDPAAIYARAGQPSNRDQREALLGSLVQVLAAFGLLDDLLPEDFELLVEAINSVIEAAR